MCLTVWVTVLLYYVLYLLSYSVTGSKSCLACPAGTESLESGSTNCSLCDSGSHNKYIFILLYYLVKRNKKIKWKHNYYSVRYYSLSVCFFVHLMLAAIFFVFGCFINLTIQDVREPWKLIHNTQMNPGDTTFLFYFTTLQHNFGQGTVVYLFAVNVQLQTIRNKIF